MEGVSELHCVSPFNHLVYEKCSRLYTVKISNGNLFKWLQTHVVYKSFDSEICFNNIWAAPSEFGTYRLCE